MMGDRDLPGLEEIEDRVKFDEDGLIPAILQDIDSKEVLMLAYMNRESLARTLSEGLACFYSRSRQELWLKGETSGNYQPVKNLQIDCDGDALLLLVEPEGPVCHTGKKSCFYRSLKTDGVEREKSHTPESPSTGDVLQELSEIIHQRNLERPAGSYTAELLQKGRGEIAKKIGEEGVELALAARAEKKEEVFREAADFIYHLLVLLEEREISLEGVISELARRLKK